MVKMKVIVGVGVLVTLMLVTLDEASCSSLVAVEPEVNSGVGGIETEAGSGVTAVDAEEEADVAAVETEKESGVDASDPEDESDSSPPFKKWRCQNHGPWLHLNNRPCFRTNNKPWFYNGWKYNGWKHVVSVGSTDDDWDDKISTIVNKGQDIAAKAVSDAHDAVQKAFERMGKGNTYHFINGNLKDGTIWELGKRFGNLFSGYNIMVQIASDYCIQHMSYAKDQVREAEILDKLEQTLAEGNEKVTALFQLLGEKVTSWSHDHMKWERGRVNVYNYKEKVLHFVNGRPVGEEFQDVDDGKQEIPNLFQDQEVVMQLNQLVDSGVITQEDMVLLSQQQNEQLIDY